MTSFTRVRVALERKKFSFISFGRVKKASISKGKGKGKTAKKLWWWSTRTQGRQDLGRMQGERREGRRRRREGREGRRRRRRKEKKVVFFVLTQHFLLFSQFTNGKTGFSLKSHFCLFSPFSLTSLSKNFQICRFQWLPPPATSLHL